jgi:acetoacetate decarboxylase
MNNGSFFLSRERIYPFFNPGEMNSQEGLYLCWETDPTVARRILPRPLELVDPEHPVVMVYVVNIREPTFAPWYMEGGIMLLSRYGQTIGGYFLNLQLSGPGAVMGMCSGREGSGLPKKVCDRIVVERNDKYASALIERKGRRIFDVQIEVGSYNDPMAGQLYKDAKPGKETRGGCLLFQYDQELASDGHAIFPRMRLLNYDSALKYQSWETAGIRSLKMEPSLDDPWAELSVVKPLGAAYSINSNHDVRTSLLAEFEGDEADDLISYLFSGRWDRSTISHGHQHYGQF